MRRRRNMLRRSAPHLLRLATWQCALRTPAGRAAGVAFKAGAVADQGEVAAFRTAVAFVAFDPRGADALEADLAGVILIRSRRDRERPVELRHRCSACAAVDDRQFAADIAA